MLVYLVVCGSAMRFEPLATYLPSPLGGCQISRSLFELTLKEVRPSSREIGSIRMIFEWNLRFALEMPDGIDRIGTVCRRSALCPYDTNSRFLRRYYRVDNELTSITIGMAHDQVWQCQEEQIVLPLSGVIHRSDIHRWLESHA
jgi:hypothetical protein